MPFLIGRKAPDFVAPAILAGGGMVEHFHLGTAIRGKFALLFFNPLAFTCVCMSELATLDRRVEAFRRRDVEVLGVTLDAQCRHSIWRNIPTERLWPASYNVIVDLSHRVCREYGLERASGECQQRGAFLIDRAGIVRYQAINDLPLSSEIDDLLRMVDAIRAQDMRASARTEPRRQPSSPKGNHPLTRRQHTVFIETV